MGFIGLRSLRAGAWAVAAISSVAAAAGLVRLLPWLLAPEVPLEVALPFARALGAAATETAFLVGIPLGFAWAASTAVERGELMALSSLGVSPLALAFRQLAYGVAAAAIAALCCLAWGSGADVPGRFAGQLVEKGKASCARAEAPRSATVPLVGVTWLCFPGTTPRVTGPLPGMATKAWFSATDLIPSDDLREVSLRGLVLVTRPDDAQRHLELHVKEGTVRGLPAWGRSPKLPAAARALLAAATALVAAFGASALVLQAAVRRRWLALIVGGLPAVGALLVLHRLDASTLSARAYGLVPAVATAIPLALAPWLGRVARSAWR